MINSLFISWYFLIPETKWKTDYFSCTKLNHKTCSGYIARKYINYRNQIRDYVSFILKTIAFGLNKKQIYWIYKRFTIPEI